MGTIFGGNLSAAGLPKYRALTERIRRGIAEGALPAGSRLPPVRELAYQLGITPGTVARAYGLLTQEGVLQAEVGRGTFVAAPRAPMQDETGPETATPAQTDQVNLFSPRLPDVGQVAAIRAALRRVAQSEPEVFLNYPTRESSLPVREAAVNWLSDRSLGPLAADDVILTHGGQNAICVCLQAILRGPAPVILVEDLSYAGFRRAAELSRADVVGVAMDEHGVIPEALEAMARQSDAQVFCTTPEVQNPTGGHAPLWRREALLKVARRFDLQILEDDCYRMGTAGAPSYRTLDPERCWHVSSISKTLTPALRVGFAVAPRGRAADLRAAAEYGYFGLAYPLAELVRILLQSPDTRRLSQEIRARIATYVRAAVNVLGGFDLNWHEDVPFIWLRLPSGWRAAAFCRAAAAQGVQIRSADEFALRNGRAPHAVRIAVNAHVALSSFEAAMMRLRQLLDDPPEQISV